MSLTLPLFPLTLVFLPLFLSYSPLSRYSHPFCPPLIFSPSLSVSTSLQYIDTARNARWAINELGLAQLPQRWIGVWGWGHKAHFLAFFLPVNLELNRNPMLKWCVCKLSIEMKEEHFNFKDDDSFRGSRFSELGINRGYVIKQGSLRGMVNKNNRG